MKKIDIIMSILNNVNISDEKKADVLEQLTNEAYKQGWDDGAEAFSESI